MPNSAINVIRIAIVEDDQIIRSGLAESINGDDRFTCTESHGSVESLLESAHVEFIDVFLLDIGLPGMSGIEGITHIRKRNENGQILVLTNFEDNDRIRASVLAGARGYLLKTTPVPRLLDALQEIHDGGAPMTSHIARIILDYLASLPKPNKLKDLTEREYEVLQRIAERRQYKQIASDLFVSIDTVRTHVRNIYAKLNVNKRREAEEIFKSANKDAK